MKKHGPHSVLLLRFLKKCSGSFLGRSNPMPLAELCRLGSWCGLRSAQMRREVSCRALCSPEPPAACGCLHPWEYWEVVLVWDALVGRLTARGGRADLTRCQGTKVFSFPTALYPSPGKTTLWASQPLAQLPQLPPGSVSSQTKPDSGLRGQEGGSRGFCHGDEL